LAAIGLLSFAAIAQLAPAFFGGLFWRRATARGAIGGMLAGFATWLYTLFLPSFLDSGTAGVSLLQHGPFGIEALRPQALSARICRAVARRALEPVAQHPDLCPYCRWRVSPPRSNGCRPACSCLTRWRR